MTRAGAPSWRALRPTLQRVGVLLTLGLAALIPIQATMQLSWRALNPAHVHVATASEHAHAAIAKQPPPRSQHRAQRRLPLPHLQRLEQAGAHTHDHPHHLQVSGHTHRSAQGGSASQHVGQHPHALNDASVIFVAEPLDTSEPATQLSRAAPDQPWNLPPVAWLVAVLRADVEPRSASRRTPSIAEQPPQRPPRTFG